MEDWMILTYKECINRFGSDYMIKKEIGAGRLYQKDKGIYSDQKNCSELEIITVKYPRAVITAESAYYYYGLTDVIPDNYVLATKRTDARIKDKNIRQVFVKDDIFDVGKAKLDYRGIIINIYSLERLLVDLIRFKQKLPFDYYKEVIGSYRDLANKLDFFEVEMYANRFRTQNAIMDAIQLEVL